MSYLKLQLYEYQKLTTVSIQPHYITLKVTTMVSDYTWDENGGVRESHSTYHFQVPEEDADTRFLLESVVEQQCPPSILADRLQETYRADGLAEILRHPDLEVVASYSTNK
jgi:hypothetical protein